MSDPESIILQVFAEWRQSFDRRLDELGKALDPAPLARVRDLDVAAYRELKRVTDKPIEALRSLAASLVAQPPQIPTEAPREANGELNGRTHPAEGTP